MTTHYAKRALEILLEEGPVELARATKRFFTKQIIVEENWLKARTYKTYLFNRLKFNAIASPYQPILVSPRRDIKYKFDKGEYSINKRGALGEIRDGQWDSELENIYNSYVVKGLKQRFEQGHSWENTVYVERARNKLEIDKKNGVYGCENINEFLDKRCSYVDNLYEEIATEGYRPESGGESDKNRKYRSKSNQFLDPLVLIGRNGEIIWMHGFHRFAIADVLNLEIPVQVRLRHKKWQETRCEIHKNGLPEGREDLRDHPDLQDILD